LLFLFLFFTSIELPKELARDHRNVFTMEKLEMNSRPTLKQLLGPFPFALLLKEPTD